MNLVGPIIGIEWDEQVYFQLSYAIKVLEYGRCIKYAELI